MKELMEYHWLCENCSLRYSMLGDFFVLGPFLDISNSGNLENFK